MKYRALLLLVLLPFSTAALAQDTVAPPTNQRFLIQVTAGQDDPTKSALAFLVAKTALEADLADGLRCPVLGYVKGPIRRRPMRGGLGEET